MRACLRLANVLTRSVRVLAPRASTLLAPRPSSPLTACRPQCPNLFFLFSARCSAVNENRRFARTSAYLYVFRSLRSRLDTLHLRYGYLKVFSLFLRRLRPRQIRVEAANPQPSPPHALASPTSLPSLEQRVSSGGALVASSLAARLRSRRISRLALRCEIGVELRLGRRSHPRTRPKNRSFAA